MKQTLQLKTSQQLTLTPQLQQSIKLLQMSTLELGSELERYLLENPLLERQEESEEKLVPPSEWPERNQPAETAPETPQENASQDSDNSSAFDEPADWGSRSSSNHDDDDEFDPILSAPKKPSLREHLLSQTGELQLSQRDRALIALLIDELDDDGYLSSSLDDMLAELPLELDVELEELSCLRRLLTQLEPVGFASLNLQEFLLLQLDNAPHDKHPARELAASIVSQHFDLLGNRDFIKLKRALSIDDPTLKAAHGLITSLRPRPSSGFDHGETHYVAPDIRVIKVGRRWVARLNQANLPKLRVNQMYASLLQQKGTSHDLGGQLQEARWLIKNIQQRFDTILKVAESIVERQQEFFELGEVAMRPMILRDVADELGLHESTISRVTTQKYLLCSRGLFELKYFFGSSVDTDSGGECSATAIKAIIKQLIDHEDNKKPLSDGAIADHLVAKGIQVARRTVAKYREAMQIPPVSQRKSL